MKKRILSVVMAMTMVLSLAACSGGGSSSTDTAAAGAASSEAASSESQASSGDTIKIGLSAKITGVDAANGDRMVKAATMAVDEANANGGVLGKQIELVVEDDQVDNTVAVNVANIFASNNDIVGVVGPWNSGQIMAAESVYKEAKIPFMGLGTNPKLLELGNEYLFLVRANDTIEAECAAQLIIDELKVKSVGIMYTTNEFGTGAMEIIQNKCEAAGMEVYPEAINIGDNDVTGQILDLKSKGAECMVVWASDAEYVITARCAYEQGLDVPVVASPAITMDQVRELCEEDWVEGWYSITDFVKDDSDETVKAFCDKYASEYGDGQNAELYVADVYSATKLMIDAIERAGSTDRDAVRTALEETKDYPMLQGNATCDSNNMLVHSCHIAQIVDYTPVKVNTISVDFE